MYVQTDSCYIEEYFKEIQSQTSNNKYHIVSSLECKIYFTNAIFSFVIVVLFF